MQALIYYISLPFLYLVSYLPFPVLYGVSNFFCFIMRDVLGYRKAVILENLKNSFPEKSEKEIKKIAQQFYTHLCDLFLETFKTLTISEKEMLERCSFEPSAVEVFDKLYKQNTNFIIVMGHFGNWEWGGNSYTLLRKNQLFVIYHPLQNKYFNNLIIDMRCRFGSKLIKMQDTFRDMVNNKNTLNATAFIADQTPQPKGAFWTTFLNQDTPVFIGTEKIAKKLGYPIVYASVNKVKRGFYQIHAEILLEDPINTKDGEISTLHTKRLEQDILRQPETWLWSHRRWKHKRPQNVQN